MAKSIILFSDGTGNSSAKLFKTNVWRMYEAVDLGPPAEGKRDQISYYDDGVGTSTFKPLSILGGAFGWGLQRNVLDIYRYACRNYRNGDDIYAFGFSRGAFTIRLVVALIVSEGLVRSETEAELEWKSRAAYRNFRAAFLPRRLKWPTKRARQVRAWFQAGLDRLKRREPYDPADNCWPKVQFVGVWDTVAAYGGPITEITRAIDNWIYPLSMPNYQLNEHVLHARHALAIDDERDAFHPLLWDELHEKDLLAKEKVKPGRLQQVWFTGMHADVGGGYPDESLSYVSLLWMMEEAEKAGLRTLKAIKDRIVALASSYGPIHDSRAGLAAYYRYQPRKISAWLDPIEPTTLSLRDPAIRRKGRPHGLLRSVNVHESVINRIATGTDRYAPITLPETFVIVPPQREGETAPQADSQTPAPAPAVIAAMPLVSPEIRGRLRQAAAAASRAAATEPIWNYVWGRRLTYFATLTATLLLVFLPFFVARLPPPPVLHDGRTGIGGVIRLLSLILPGFAGKWVETYADNPFYFLLLAAIVFAFFRLGTRLERTLRDKARRVWKAAIEDGTLPEPGPSRIQAFRNSRGYQRFIQFFKWYFLPNWVVAPLLVLLGLWIAAAVFVQTRLPFLENDTFLCQPSPGTVADITTVRGDFLTRDICSKSFGRVVEDQRYVFTFDVVDPWSDSIFPTSPEGIAMGDRWWTYLGAPFRRVLAARYLQPVVEVRPIGEKRNWHKVQIFPLPLRAVGDSVTLYRAEFVFPRSGELFLFANDAMIPLKSSVWGTRNYRYFYETSGAADKNGVVQPGNLGSACVTVERVSITEPPIGAPPAGSICGRAAERNTKQQSTN